MIRLTLILIIFLVGNTLSSDSDDIEFCESINLPDNKENCNLITDDFTISGFKCCYIKANVDGVEGKACIRIKDNERAIETVYQSIQAKQGRAISIQCYSHFPLASNIIFLFLLLF